MAAADRRELILEAARESFAEGGYHRTSLDAIAERAGVSKALLYEHFASKRELHAAMLEAHVHELIERIESVPHAYGEDPDLARCAQRCLDLASGRYDALSGGYFELPDDLDALLAEKAAAAA